MNLLADQWMPVIRRDGSRAKIAVYELLDGYQNNAVVDLESPRPDFYNALFQLLIGIVQVAAAPEDEEDWADLWGEPYSPDVFKEKILKYEECFEIDSDGPAFMQDLDFKFMLSQTADSIYRLLIGTPGENTVALNRDFFVKERTPFQIDLYWAAVALFLTQQICGPPDGGGHREGLRGSGALSTLIAPVGRKNDATVWERVWANIFPQDEVAHWNGNTSKEVFPWMTSTKSSTGDKKTGFDDLHPLSVYWGMPWRVRLVSEATPRECHLTGMQSQHVVTQYCRYKHGYMYTNLWSHPFTPLLRKVSSKHLDSNKKLTMRATSDRFRYSNWSVLCLENEEAEYARSTIVRYFFDKRLRELPEKDAFSFRLWASGFDMVPGKATVTNWSEATMPLLSIPPESAHRFRERVEAFVEQASTLTKGLQSSIKEAWFSRPKDAKGSVSFVSGSFWQNTEPDFYRLLDRMVQNLDDANEWAQCAKQWRDRITQEVYRLFDQWALAQQEDGLDMRRVVDARNRLKKEVGKVWKNLNNYIELE